MKVLIIGCGVMGSKFARGLSSQKGINLVLHNKELIKAKTLANTLNCHFLEAIVSPIDVDIVLLAVKPKDLEEVKKELQNKIPKNALILSILAGKSLRDLKEAFPQNPLIRMMPNVAISVGKGLIGLTSNMDHQNQYKKIVEELFKRFGELIWLEEEKYNAFTALAASGPAFLLVIIEALMEAGIYLGLSSEISQHIVTHMVEGTALLLEKNAQHPAELKNSICSPGGTTIEGIKELEKFQVRAAMLAAVSAACLKAEKL